MALNRFFHGFRRGLKETGSAIISIINSVLLTVVYLLGVGLPSLAARVFKKEFLETKTGHTSTYWSELNLRKNPIEKYARQF